MSQDKLGKINKAVVEDQFGPEWVGQEKMEKDIRMSQER